MSSPVRGGLALAHTACPHDAALGKGCALVLLYLYKRCADETSKRVAMALAWIEEEGWLHE